MLVLRAREILYHGKCHNCFQIRYNYLKVRDVGVSKVCCKRAVVLERAISFLRETAYKQSVNPVEVRLVFEAYNSYLKEEGFTDNFNHITRFAELVLSHTKEFEINKNEHNVNVFILKGHYVKSTASFPSFDVSMKFLNNMRKIVTPLRKAVDDVSLEFNKIFDQANSLPNELISLVGSLVENIQSASNPSQSTLTIAGLIAYNYKKRTHKPEEAQQNVASHQLAAHETPIVSYASLKLYSCIRSKNILQKLHSVGICSSYNRVIQILSDWASKSLKVYKSTDKVIPLKLQERVFTVFTKDNVDKNSSSNQGTKHFRGTSICTFSPSKLFSCGSDRREVNNQSENVIHDFTLPTSYTDIPHVMIKCDKYSCPISTVNIPDDIKNNEILKANQMEEIKWMESILTSDTNDRKCWSGYHSGQKRTPTPPSCNSCIFPLLKDVVHTINMQHHLISLFIEYTHYLNPQQVTAVDCSDQPIFALSKINQWLIFIPSIFSPFWRISHRKGCPYRKWSLSRGNWP